MLAEFVQETVNVALRSAETEELASPQLANALEDGMELIALRTELVALKCAETEPALLPTLVIAMTH